MTNDRPSYEEMVEALTQIGEFKYDDITRTVYLNGEPVTKEVESIIRVNLREMGYWKNLNAFKDAWWTLAIENS